MVGSLAQLQLLRAPVATKPAQVLILLVALFVVGGLVERDQRHKVVGPVLPEAAGLCEAACHVAGQVTAPLNYQLQVVGGAEPRGAGEGAVREPLRLLVLVVRRQEGPVVMIP